MGWATHVPHHVLRQDFAPVTQRVQAELLELGEDPLGVFFVVGGAHVVRAGGESPHVLAQVVGAGDGAELLLPVALGGERAQTVAELAQGVRLGHRDGVRRAGTP
jgi:hypothetical protein